MKSNYEFKNMTSTGAAIRRRYDDAYGTAHALDLVGERWALLAMRELIFGPKRFSDLSAQRAERAPWQRGRTVTYRNFS